jgi:hypothetical protein
LIFPNGRGFHLPRKTAAPDGSALPGERGEQPEDLRPADLLGRHVPHPGAAEGGPLMSSSGMGAFAMPLPSSVQAGWPGSFCAGLANDDGEYTIAPWNTCGK